MASTSASRGCSHYFSNSNDSWRPAKSASDHKKHKGRGRERDPGWLPPSKCINTFMKYIDWLHCLRNVTTSYCSCIFFPFLPEMNSLCRLGTKHSKELSWRLHCCFVKHLNRSTCIFFFLFFLLLMEKKLPFYLVVTSHFHLLPLPVHFPPLCQSRQRFGYSSDLPQATNGTR